MLNEVTLAPDFSISAIAEHTDGLSGSDLKELCRNAAMGPVREYVRKAGGSAAVLKLGQEKVSLSFHLAAAPVLS